jgi:uncharacterized membrane protein YfcA
MEYVWYLLTGLLSGFLAGLFGIGGGIVVVPMLAFLFAHHFPYPLIMHMAISTSLAAMIFTAMASASAHYRRGFIDFYLFYRFSPGLLVGVIIGFVLAMQFSSTHLRVAFGIFLLLNAVYMMFSKKGAAKATERPHALMLGLMGIFVGMLSSFFGVGGGIVMIPFFVFCGIETHRATGTSALCGLPVAVTGSVLAIISGEMSMIDSTPGLLGFVYWPAALLVAFSSILSAPLGTRISVYLPSPILNWIFSILLVVIGVTLLF